MIRLTHSTCSGVNGVGSPIHPIAGHRHHVAAGLEGVDDTDLVVRVVPLPARRTMRRFPLGSSGYQSDMATSNPDTPADVDDPTTAERAADAEPIRDYRGTGIVWGGVLVVVLAVALLMVGFQNSHDVEFRLPLDRHQRTVGAHPGVHRRRGGRDRRDRRRRLASAAPDPAA
jgi:hypothetical protein